MAHLFAPKTLVSLTFEIQSKSILHINKTKVFHSNISVHVEQLFIGIPSKNCIVVMLTYFVMIHRV